jgi:hypothetical protein
VLVLFLSCCICINNLVVQLDNRFSLKVLGVSRNLCAMWACMTSIIVEMHHGGFLCGVGTNAANSDERIGHFDYF